MWIYGILWIGISILLVWQLSFDQRFQTYGVVIAVGMLLWGLRIKLGKRLRKSVTSEKVVDLKSYREQKRKTEAQQLQQENQWVSVLETLSIIEADLVIAMLTSEEIATHVLNRHNASILIHPMGEFTIKVLVAPQEAIQARQLIDRCQSGDSPDSSKDPSPV